MQSNNLWQVFFCVLTGLYVENNTVLFKTVLCFIFKISFIETVCAMALVWHTIVLIFLLSSANALICSTVPIFIPTV